MAPGLIAPAVAAYDRYKVALGGVDGYRRAVATGHSGPLNAGHAADIWPGNNLSPIFDLSTVAPLEIVSNNAQDGAAGSGARTVTISGLDSSYQVLTQTITLAGVTPVPIPLPLLRINMASVVTAGAGRVNAGKLTIRPLGGGPAYAIIEKQVGLARHGWLTVPDGQTFVVAFVSLDLLRVTPVAGDVWVEIVTWLQSNNGVGPVEQWRVPFALNSAAPHFALYVDPGFAIPARADFALRVGDVSADGLQVSSLIVGCLIADAVWM